MESTLTFKGTYSKDYNILNMHKAIIDHFKTIKKEKIERLQAKINIEKEKIKRRQRIIDRRHSERIIGETMEELRRLENDEQLNKYLAQTKYYIDKYTEIGPLTISVMFGQGDVVDDSYDQERLSLIAKYFAIAEQYAKIDLIREIQPKRTCVGCGFPIDQISTIGDNSEIKYCQCGATIDILNRPSNVVDNDLRTTDSEDEKNFRKSFLCLQGAENITLPAKLFIDLDTYFRKYSLPTGDIIRDRPLLNNGRKEGTSRKMLIDALSATGYSSFYEHLTLITHEYWGWPLNNLSYIEEKLMDHYHKTQAVFRSLSNKGRSSNINRQFRLLKHLEILYHMGLLDILYTLEDFKMVATREILLSYDEIWKQMCEKSADPDIKFYKTV